MMLTLLALTSISSSLAVTKVATRKLWSQCTSTSGGTQFGSSQVAPSIKNGCSDLGTLDCAAGKFWSNSTDGLAACQNKLGQLMNTTGTCQAGNYTLTCEDIDGTTAASVTMYTGNDCNGTAQPFGVISAGVCTILTSSNYVKMWTNTTGPFVAVYSAAGCASADQTNIVKLAVTGSSGCAVGVLTSGYQSVKWAMLEVATPTSAPTNNTNTTAPKSSGSFVAASLASAVLAAASLML
jgi:hypothetical protein